MCTPSKTLRHQPYGSHNVPFSMQTPNIQFVRNMTQSHNVPPIITACIKGTSLHPMTQKKQACTDRFVSVQHACYYIMKVNRCPFPPGKKCRRQCSPYFSCIYMAVTSLVLCCYYTLYQRTCQDKFVHFLIFLVHNAHGPVFLIDKLWSFSPNHKIAEESLCDFAVQDFLFSAAHS